MRKILILDFLPILSFAFHKDSFCTTACSDIIHLILSNNKITGYLLIKMNFYQYFFFKLAIVESIILVDFLAPQLLNICNFKVEFEF
jgi:hypothetical protein